MNKLQGFLELQKAGLPAVSWREYKSGDKLDDNLLWTVRSAVETGNDLNLPRKVGVTAAEAEEFADELKDRLGVNDMVIYYPFFIASKSGVLEVKTDRIVIEAVYEDLWNLVTYNKLDVSLVITDDDFIVHGEENFFGQDELIQLIDYAKIVKRLYSSTIWEGKSIFLEWSFGSSSDLNKNGIGDNQLIFYEMRSVV